MATHAAIRLAERYGLALVPDLANQIWDLVEVAQRRGGRSARACRLGPAGGFERWLVSVSLGSGHKLLLPVLEPRQQKFVTFLTLSAGARR